MCAISVPKDVFVQNLKKDVNSEVGKKVVVFVDYSTHYQYDERGNRRRQTEPSGCTTEYRYDADDRLIEVKRYRRAPAAGDTTPPEMQAKYGYDGFGRRLWKLVKDGKATPRLTVFSWDANLLSSEEVFESEFHFWDAFAYPKEPEL